MNEELSKERIDQAVSSKLGISRKASLNLIKSGHVSVNKQLVSKASMKVSKSDKIQISKAALKEPIIEPLELPVIYEDDNIAVINKPVGVLTHSKGALNPEATAATWLADRVPSMIGNRAGIVHRLDRATSGVMVLAKNPDTLAFLQKQFSQRKTKKKYAAIVEGLMSEKEAVIDMPIERNPKRPQTFRVGANGKKALTHYRVISANKSYSLLELSPETGRTHQLRVHLKQIGHPIVGDSLYGGKAADRMYLHAKSLEITLPGGGRRIFSVATPKVFKEFIS